MVSLCWLGVAGIELKTESDPRGLVIDPYFTRIPFWRQFIGRIQPDREVIDHHLPDARFILISHAHYDHLLDVPVIAQQTDAIVYGSANTVALLRTLGVPPDQARLVVPGDHFDFGEFTVEVMAAVHEWLPIFTPGSLHRHLDSLPLHAIDYRMDALYAYRITVNGLTLQTDPGLRPGNLLAADVLMLLPDRPGLVLKRVLAQVQPRLVIAVHWDDFWRPLSQPLRSRPALPSSGQFPGRVNLRLFTRRVAQYAPSARVVVPQLFEIFQIGKVI